MVELYNLSPRMMIPPDSGRSAGHGVGCWPSYIDQHVAQLDFDVSMMGPTTENDDIEDEEDDDHPTVEVEDVFGSVMACDDPSMISTDSLDMDTLRARCAQPTDYKLTFEDSGQWTTSGIGGSFTTNATASPPVPNPSNNTRSTTMTRRAATATAKMLLRNTATNNNAKEGIGTLYTTGADHLISLRLLEELNNEDEKTPEDGQLSNKWRKKDFLDELLNNNNINNEDNNNRSSSQMMNFKGAAELTSWGRIRDSSGQRMEPFNSEKVYSLPELNKRRSQDEGRREFSSFASSPAMMQDRVQIPPAPPPKPKRPIVATNLVANFMDQRQREEKMDWAREEQESPPVDYVYSETYLGNGRYIDMNENEIGYVPANTAPIQKMDLNAQRRELLGGTADPQTPSSSSSLSHHRLRQRMGNRPTTRRTFADFSSSQTVPDLKFLALSHKVPSICPTSSTSLDGLLRRVKEDGGVEAALVAESTRLILDTDSGGGGSEDVVPDSGLGSSHSEGPSHIEDWSSLSVLLPRNVVEACSFFKSNSFLLTASSNNIEHRHHDHQCGRNAPPRSFTASGGLSARHHRPSTACHACLQAGGGAAGMPPSLCSCDLQQQRRACSEQPAADGARSAVYTRTLQEESTRACASQQRKLRLHAQELAIIGLPMYDRKRSLVERVVEGVAEIIRGSSSVVLMSALERLLGDQLLPGVRAWAVICQVTGQGPVTRSVYQLIQELEASEKPEHSRVSHFFKGLLAMHSLDGWLSYVVLKEPMLRGCYADGAFLLGAHTAYRSLWWRLMDSVELLSVLSQCGGAGKRWEKQQHQRRQRHVSWSRQQSSDADDDAWARQGAARLPADSRVPKSSSVPTKLCRNLAPTVTPIVEEEKLQEEAKLEDVQLSIDEQPKKEEDVKEKSQPPVNRPSRVSRIPVLRSHQHAGGYSPSASSCSRSRSSHSRTPPVMICRPVAEEDSQIDDAADQQGTALPVRKGESVRVLSVRGAFSRCARLEDTGSHRGGTLLAIRNGVVPTKWLNMVGLGGGGGTKRGL